MSIINNIDLQKTTLEQGLLLQRACLVSGVDAYSDFWLVKMLKWTFIG